MNVEKLEITSPKRLSETMARNLHHTLYLLVGLSCLNLALCGEVPADCNLLTKDACAAHTDCSACIASRPPNSPICVPRMEVEQLSGTGGLPIKPFLCFLSC